MVVPSMATHPEREKVLKLINEKDKIEAQIKELNLILTTVCIRSILYTNIYKKGKQIKIFPFFRIMLDFVIHWSMMKVFP